MLQIAKDGTLPERSIVAPVIIRSKPFDKFAFRLTETSFAQGTVRMQLFEGFYGLPLLADNQAQRH